MIYYTDLLAFFGILSLKDPPRNRDHFVATALVEHSRCWNSHLNLLAETCSSDSALQVSMKRLNNSGSHSCKREILVEDSASRPVTCLDHSEIGSVVRGMGSDCHLPWIIYTSDAGRRE